MTAPPASASSLTAATILELGAQVRALRAENAKLREALTGCVDALGKLGAISELTWSREFIALEVGRAALAKGDK